MNNKKLKDYIQDNWNNSESLIGAIEDYLEQEYQQRGKVFKRSSPFGMIINVLAGLTQLIFFYIEDALVESNIYTARRPDTIRGFSSLIGHQPHSRKAATGALNFSFNLGGGDDIEGNKLTISNRTILENQDNGLQYTLLLPEDEMSFAVDSIESASFQAQVIQGEFSTSVFQSNGQKMQSFTISNQAIDTDWIEVFVNGEEWDISQSMYDLQNDQNACFVRNNFEGGVDIIFGNGSFGKIPRPGSDIRVDYLITNGQIGDLKESTNWEFETPGTDVVGNEVDLNDKYQVSIEEDIIFGSNEESIEFTRNIAPKKSMTFSLINEDDYTAFLKRFDYFSTVKTYTERSDIGDGNIVEVLLIPNLNRRLGTGDNYFSVAEERFMLTDFEKDKIRNFLALNGAQAPNIDLQILNPKIKKYAIDVIVRAFEGEEENIVDQITDVTSKYFLTTNRKDYIPTSDLVYLYEKINGLDSVNVFFVSEENERNKLENGQIEGNGIIGLDQMNDIEIDKNELPIIRGGWRDRFGQNYESNLVRSFIYRDILESNTPLEKGALNIYFQPSIKRTVSAQQVEQEIRNLN